MAEELNPIQKIRKEITTRVIAPIGRAPTEGVRGNLVRAKEAAKDTNKIAAEFEQRFATVSQLVARIAAKSTVSADRLQTAEPAQQKALDISSTVLNGTRNGNARDALQTMHTINRDAPALTDDMTRLKDQSTELRDSLRVAGVKVEEAVDQSYTNVEVTFAPPITAAPEAVRLSRKYIDKL